MRSFEKIKLSGNGEITILFTDVGKSMHRSRKFNVANMYFNDIHENKILAKSSEFTESGSTVIHAVILSLSYIGISIQYCRCL